MFEFVERAIESNTIMQSARCTARTMAPREDPSSFDAPADSDHAQREACAPIRQTLAKELDALFRFAMARLNHNTQLAEDVVQQALLIAMAHASPPSEVQAQRAWLRGIAHNVIRSQMRSMRRGRAAVQKAAFEQRGAQSRFAESSVKRVDEHRAQVVRSLYLAVNIESFALSCVFHPGIRYIWERNTQTIVQSDRF